MKSTILIIDDDYSARETLVAMLEGQGYQLEMAINGTEALEIAQRTLPDLILLDVMMPEMDGFEVCRRMRAMPKLAEVPILILTALDDPMWLVQGIESGADDFLSKPISRQEIIARARTITRLNRYRTLLEQREDLRKMAGRVVSAQEDERKRLSRELHDDLGQALTTQMLTLRNLQAEFSSPEEPLYKGLENFHKQTHEIYTSIHHLVENLRPPALEALSLEDAMQTYCTDFTRRSGLEVVFDIDQNLPKFSDLYKITLYRILQEALTNITKHAQAKKIWVELSLEDEMISLTIQDNGKGFKYSQDQMQGMGLNGIKERLTLADGRFTINSTPERGTILVAQLPLQETLTAEEVSSQIFGVGAGLAPVPLGDHKGSPLHFEKIPEEVI